MKTVTGILVGLIVAFSYVCQCSDDADLEVCVVWVNDFGTKCSGVRLCRLFDRDGLCEGFCDALEACGYTRPRECGDALAWERDFRVREGATDALVDD